jgi:hypothetical protein
VRVSSDEPAAVAALEHVADELVRGVEPGGIRAVQIPHPFREVAPGRADQQVIVVWHQAVAVAMPAALGDDPAERAEEDAAVVVRPEDLPPRDPASGDVVEVVGGAQSGLPGHTSRLRPRP